MASQGSNTNGIANGEGLAGAKSSTSTGYGSDKDNQSSVTQSGINTKNIQIQQDPTGELAKSVYTDITTETAAQHSGSLNNVFDKDRVQQEIDLQVKVSQDFNRNGQSALAEINTKVKNHLDEAKALEKQAQEAEARGDTAEAEKLTAKAKDERQSAGNWQHAGVGLNMLISGLSAPTQSATGIAAATVSPAISYQIGQEFKNLASQNEDGKLTASQETAHILAHAVLGAAVAAAGDNNALAGAISAGGAEAAAPIISSYLYNEKDGSKLTAEQKETVTAITNLLGTATGAVIGDTTANAVQGSLNAQNAVKNNDVMDEIEFAIRHPKIALLIGSVSKKPEFELNPNISTIASTFQLNLFDNRKFGGEGGVGNAFRHALWQAIITNQFGENIAIQVGNSHESGFKIDFSKRQNISLNKADEMIDQLNNQIGRKIAIAHPTASNKELAINILRYYLEEGLYQAERNNSNTYNVIRKRISLSEYNNAMLIMNKLDETGAGPVIQEKRKTLQNALMSVW